MRKPILGPHAKFAGISGRIGAVEFGWPGNDRRACVVRATRGNYGEKARALMVRNL